MDSKGLQSTKGRIDGCKGTFHFVHYSSTLFDGFRGLPWKEANGVPGTPDPPEARKRQTQVLGGEDT